VHFHQSRAGSHAVMRGHTAKQYDRVSHWLLPRIYRAVAAELATTAGQKAELLDVGTGPGRLLVGLAESRPDLRLTGVDPSEDMVALGRANVQKAGVADRVTVQVGFAEDLPFPTGSFDLVISTFSAHHWADPARALAEQARVLRPGGQLRIYDVRGKNLRELAGEQIHTGRAYAGAEKGPPHRRAVISSTGRHSGWRQGTRIEFVMIMA
jgi:ubiquinone/menaquinone biosynthesis C-methylase UbiE